MTPRGLHRTQAAEYIGCSPRLFDAMVFDGRLPKPRLFNSKKIWDRLELDEAFEALPRDGEENDWDGIGEN
jgi:hypothetical protein